MLFIIFHESDLQYGVTDRHCLTKNSVGFACSPNDASTYVTGSG